jgi:iron(III) transport system ATP-binding protein
VLALVGCSVSAADRPLPVDNVEYWSVPAEGSRIPAPRAVHATAKGEVYVLDNVGRVLVFADSGTLLRQWWMPEYSVGRPEKIRLLKDGRLAVADTHYQRVVFFDEEGALAGTLGSYGREQEQFIYPVAIAQDDEENLYVCEYGGNDRIQKFTKEGKYLLQFGGFGTGRGEFQRPSGIAWHDHRLFVVDAFNNRIQVFSEQGELVEILGSGAADEALYYPYDIAVSPAGEIYVVEYGGGRVSRLDLQGRLTGRFGSTGAGENQFNTPWGMCLDSRGCVYVADTGNRRIVRLHL